MKTASRIAKSGLLTIASAGSLAVRKMLTLLTIELLAHVPNADNCQHQIPHEALQLALLARLPVPPNSL